MSLTDDYLRGLEHLNRMLDLPFDPSTVPPELAGLPADHYGFHRAPFDPSVPGAEEKATPTGWRLRSAGRAYAQSLRET